MSGPGWFIYEIGFLQQKPSDYICTYKDPLQEPACTVENICNNDVNVAFESWEANPDSDKTLYNWQ